ncbi:MAG: hypothetical protein RLP44_30690 [Aggregatilineales bacterium]
MRDLRPDLTLRYIDAVDKPELWEGLRHDWVKIPQTGFWGEDNEWAYFLHGPGCRLTHVETGEIVEWDVGDIDRFNFNWFVNNLHSLIKQGKRDDDIDVICSILPDIEHMQDMTRDELSDQCYKWEKQIRPILEQLSDLVFLSRGSSFTYRIVK